MNFVIGVVEFAVILQAQYSNPLAKMLIEQEKEARAFAIPPLTHGCTNAGRRHRYRGPKFPARFDSKHCDRLYYNPRDTL